MKRLVALFLLLSCSIAFAQQGIVVGPNPTATGQAATGQIPGTATNDSATAGNVGEYRSASTADTGTSQAGSTVTMTIASPAVVTWGTTIPYVINGAAAAVINFTTTGALPTGVVAGTNYYVIGSSISGNTFQIATSADNAIAGTAINTSGSQSGTHTGLPRVIEASGGANIVAAISLTAGDWDVSADGAHLAAAATSLTSLTSTLSLSNAASSTVPGRYLSTPYNAFVPGVSNTAQHVGPARFSLSATTTVYFIMTASFASDVLSGWGGMRARRVR